MILNIFSLSRLLKKHRQKDVEGGTKRKKLILIISMSIGVLSLLGSLYYLIFVNTVNVPGAAFDFSVVHPVQIEFNKKVSHDAAIGLSPAADYKVDWSDSLLTSSVNITPKSRWLTSTRYHLHLTSVKTAFKQPVPELNYTFSTQTAPRIVGSSPTDKSTNVSVTSELTLKLDSPNENLIPPTLTFTPDVRNTLTLSTDKMSYKVKFLDPLQQSTAYSLNISDKYRRSGSSRLHLYTASFSTVPKVQISDFVPQGDMNFKNSTIKITFDNDIDKKTAESAFSVSPAIDGTISWLDDRTLTYTPKSPLALNTTYNIKLAAGMKNSVGGTLEADYSNSFTTIGYVTAYITPGWGASEIGLNSPVRVYFNQDIDHGTAQNNFTVSPNVTGSYSWYGNTMTFSPVGQSPLTYYQVIENAGVGSINGLSSTQSYSTAYTTVTPVTMLNVSFHRQNYNLSCEAASLKMALGEKGVNVSEDDIFAVMGYDGPSQKTSDNKWGDPNRGFVGSVNGNGTTTGYGVYWGPIARAGNAFRSSEAFSGGNLQTLTSALDAGNPIVIWGTIGSPSAMSWTDYSTGNAVSAVKGEHARVVKGYRGFANNPIGFYIVDPIYGNLYWDSQTLLGNWSWFNNSGVIVH